MKRIMALTALCLMALAVAATAEVVVKRQITFEIPGMPATDMTSTEQLTADRCYSLTEFAPNSMIAQMGGQQRPEANITRLDKGVMWNVNEGSKTYQEMSLANMKDMMNKPGPMQEKDESDLFDWTYNVEPQEKSEINKIPATGVIVTATGVGKENPDIKVTITYEQWSSTDVPGIKTLEAYDNKFSEVTGMGTHAREKMIKRMAARFGSVFTTMTEKAGAMDGFPVKIAITAKSTEKPQSPMGITEEDLKKMDPETRKKMEQFVPKGDQGEGGINTLFSVNTEVTSVETEETNESIFEIPEGYTKK
jgi:hypothetical protein